MRETYKERILCAATEIISESGLGALTITTLAKKCSISKKTFYMCFSSKENLIRSINGLHGADGGFSANTREKIIRAAIDLFPEYGYNETSMERIAAFAGVNKGSIYNYFPAKDDLFAQSVIYEMDKRRRFADSVLETVGDPVDILKRYTDYNCEYIMSKHARLMVLGRALSYTNEKIRECIDSFTEYRIGLILEIIEKGKSVNVFKKDIDSTLAAKLYIALFNNFSFEPAIDLPSIRNKALDLILGYLTYSIR